MKMVERNCHYVELHIYIIHLKKKIDFTCSARIKKAFISCHNWLHPNTVSILFPNNDLSVHPYIFKKFPHFFPITLSLLLSLLHCRAVPPPPSPQEREVERKTASKGGKRERKREAKGKVSISQETNRLTLRR